MSGKKNALRKKLREKISSSRNSRLSSSSRDNLIVDLRRQIKKETSSSRKSKLVKKLDSLLEKREEEDYNNAVRTFAVTE